MRKPLVIAVAAALAGCAKPAVDTTPETPTAVFETRTSFSGIQGNFPFETTEKRFVRSDMSREESARKGTGQYSGWIMTKMMGGAGETHISRLDRKLQWMVNEKDKQYVECPIAGCPMPAGMEKMQKPEAQKPEQPKQKAEDGCTTSITSNTFTIKPTGEKKQVNGFDAERYDGAWVVRMEDRKKRATTSTLKLDIWTAALNGEMRKAMDTEEAFGRNYLASVTQPQVPMGKPGQGPVMPPDIMQNMSAYLGTLNTKDRDAFMRAAKEFEKIKGHRVYTKFDWFVDGNACGADEQQKKEQQQSSGPKSASDMAMSAAMNLFAKKEEKPAGPQPVMSFTVEVKQLGVVPVRDSVFLVPAGYKKSN